MEMPKAAIHENGFAPPRHGHVRATRHLLVVQPVSYPEGGQQLTDDPFGRRMFCPDRRHDPAAHFPTYPIHTGPSLLDLYFFRPYIRIPPRRRGYAGN